MFWRAAHSALAPRAHLERYSSGTHRYSSVLETSQTPWGERIWSDPHPVLIGIQNIANSMGRAHLERYSSGTHRYSSVLKTSQTPWEERIWSGTRRYSNVANSKGRAHLERHSLHGAKKALKVRKIPSALLKFLVKQYSACIERHGANNWYARFRMIFKYMSTGKIRLGACFSM